ncbi:MAG: response regulator [Betaproteobacteria bacterium]
MRILVVDDNPDVANSLAELLRIDGNDEVRVEFNAAAAIASMRESLPDLVLCDLQLADGMDGTAFARYCRRDPQFSGIRMLAISGHSGEDDRQAALAAGFEGLLVKPVGYAMLTDAVRHGVSGQRP